MDEVLVKRAVVKGHNSWVTGISTPQVADNDTFITTGRDKQLIVWKLDDEQGAIPMKAMTGHGQAIQDCTMSSDGNFALTASWDKTLRLWDLKAGASLRSFVGHTSDVFSCAFSPDNRQIISGSRDRSIKLWNTLAECKYTVEKGSHTDWVSCVRFSPVSASGPNSSPLVVSCGWDKLAKVWNISKGTMTFDLIGHSAVLHTIAISPDGSLCASGGKDGNAMLWDANDGRYLSMLEADSSINALCFSPCNYWLCAATDKSVKVWSLESSKSVLAELTPPDAQTRKTFIPWCTSLSWNKAGDVLFAGTSTGEIHIYKTVPSAAAAYA